MVAQPRESTQARLDLLKTLGDNTRYAIYLELARSPLPLATADIAEPLCLHPNTVRPHLERMREVGLLELHTAPQGAVGRPQHRYSLAPDAPSLGLESPSFPLLARMLLGVAELMRAGSDEALEAGRDQGRADADTLGEVLVDSGEDAASVPCLQALLAVLDRLGFDPAAGSEVDVAGAGDRATVAFTHCPFSEMAEANPELVCGLHRGLVEGFVEAWGGLEVSAFHTLVHQEPCQVSLVGTRG